MTALPPIGDEALEEAFRHCAALTKERDRDAWLGALYAPEASRNGLMALAAFDYEIRQVRFRAREPHLAAIRLAWQREAALGERDAEAAGSPVAMAMRATVQAFALPPALVEAMTDAPLTEIAPGDDFALAAFERYAAQGEGARLQLASRIAAGGRDLDGAQAHEPAGTALALTRLLQDLAAPESADWKLFPADVAERNGAALADIGARKATPPVMAAVNELRALARERLAEAERRLRASPAAILPAFVPLAAVRLDLDGLDRAAARPFDPPEAASAFRRQWAIWRWARRFRLRVTD